MTRTRRGSHIETTSSTAAPGTVSRQGILRHHGNIRTLSGRGPPAREPGRAKTWFGSHGRACQRDAQSADPDPPTRRHWPHENTRSRQRPKRSGIVDRKREDTNAQIGRETSNLLRKDFTLQAPPRAEKKECWPPRLNPPH